MNNKMYKLMNWPQIEAIVYAESDRPSEILGPHSFGTSTLYQTFIPGAKEVRLTIPAEDKSIKMEMVDEEGFFAVLRTGKPIMDYSYLAEYEDGSVSKIVDPYKYPIKIKKADIKKFAAGELIDAYELMGAHVEKIDGTEGVRFAFWAPNARRVSVIGKFNKWDGRTHQMNRFEDTGIYELFIPGVCVGDEYLFEVNMKGGLSKKVVDPYSRASIKSENGYKSVVSSDDNFKWSDEKYMKERRGSRFDASSPISIYECELSYFADDKNVDYISIAKEISKHAKNIGYTHIELKPIAEYMDDESHGYETIMYYAPTSRYGSAEQFAQMVDIFHANGLRVILDWTLAHPSAAEGILRKIDGTACYEHADSRQGIHPQWGTLLFNYGRGEVRSFLKSNALYWLTKFHLDGLRIDSLASVLCLDYGRNNGEWIANMYGGNENLDALDFIKNLNNEVKKAFPGVVMVAEDSSAWPKVTAPVEDGGLGFSFKWNIGWRDDYIRYISKDPIFRAGSHNDLILSMLYCYSDRFALPLSLDAKELYDNLPGDEDAKLAGIRLSLAYMMMHPGVKLLANGFDSIEAPKDGITKLVKALNKFYLENTALFELDGVEEGFEWINNMDASGCTLSFIRKGKREKDFLIVCANFAGIDQEKEIGVTIPGKYTCVFNSESTLYGGDYKNKEAILYTVDGNVDAKPYYINVDLPALSLSVFSYEPFDENDRDYMEKLQKEAKEKAAVATERAAKEEARAKAAEKKAVAEQKKAEEAAKAAELARIKAEEEYAKAVEEMEKARIAMEVAKEAAKEAEMATHRLKVTEQSMNYLK